MVDHPSFITPSNINIKIWRYMDLSKYIAFLQRKALFFTRAPLLGDPFEGSATKPIVAAREYILKNRGSDPALAAFKDLPESVINVGSVFKEMLRYFLVNCWHMNEHESAAMWNLYSKSNESVCIQSTYDRLRRAVPECVLIGEVKYIDLRHRRIFD